MLQKITFQIAKWLVGLLFIFSGLIKANDPIGFGYKLQEYFDVFHVNFLYSWATSLAIFICALEIICGALLLLGLHKKLVIKGLLSMIVFFTFLTFVSAVFKVVTSCGCFGDAIPLTPWQSFAKDVLLFILILIVVKYKDFIKPINSSKSLEKTLTIIVVFFSFLVGIYSYNFLPTLDFLPYKVGANIPQNMTIPEGAAQDEYLIIYELKNIKTGESKKMSDKEYLSTGIWKDNNWEVVGSPTKKLIKKGYEVKIKDLIITDANGTDYTKEIVENPFYNLVIVAYDLNSTNEKALGNLNALAMDLSEQYNIRTVLLTSNTVADAEKLSKKLNLIMEVFYADAVPLKSMVRANPGVLLLRNGDIINKWHYNTMPNLNDLINNYIKL